MFLPFPLLLILFLSLTLSPSLPFSPLLSPSLPFSPLLSPSFTLLGATATNSPRQSSFRNGKNKSPSEKKKKGKDKDKGGTKMNSNDFEIVPNETAGVSTVHV